MHLLGIRHGENLTAKLKVILHCHFLTGNLERLYTRDANLSKRTTQQSFYYAELRLGSLVDNIADTDCWQHLQEIRSNSTIEAGNTISLHNTLSQSHKSVLCIVRC